MEISQVFSNSVKMVLNVTALAAIIELSDRMGMS